MSLKVNDTNSLNKKINFKSEPHQETKENKPQESEKEKSFYERNKNALIALSAIGAAAIAIGTHHYIKNRNLKNVTEEASDKITKKGQKTFDEFEKKLSELGEKDDATDIIKPILAENNPVLKMQTIEFLLKENGKHINANNWEDIFNTLVSMKPSENIKSEKITSRASELYNILAQKNIVTSEVLDKIIAKLPEVSDEIKLNLSQKFISSTYSKNTLSTEQTKKVLDMLNNVKQEKFDYYTSDITHYKDYSTSGLRYYYNKKLFTEAAIDEKYLADIKNILNGNTLPDDIKLQLMDDIYYSKFIDNKNDNKTGIALIKEMLKSFENNKVDTYKTPNSIISFEHDKFSLGSRLFSRVNTYDNFGVFTTEEKLKIAQSLKEASKKVKVNTSTLGGNAHYINEIYSKELDLRSKNFFEKFNAETSLNDFDKFIDDMLNGYEEAKGHFIKGGIFEELDEIILSQRFLNFRFDVCIMIMKKDLELLSKSDIQGSKQLNDIFEKISTFAKKHFNTSENKYYKKSGSSNSQGSKFNFNDFINDKVKEAKSTLSEFLKKDESLKEFVEIIENNKLDKTALKNIKRKFAIKYHPDKAEDDNQRAEFTRIFQEINNAVETLEKTL